MMVWKEAVDDMVYCKEFTASSAAKISPPYALYSTSSNFRYDLHDKEDSWSLSPMVRLDEMHHRPTLIPINTTCKDIARAARGACTGSKQACLTESLVQTGMGHTVHQAALIVVIETPGHEHGFYGHSRTQSMRSSLSVKPFGCGKSMPRSKADSMTRCKCIFWPQSKH